MACEEWAKLKWLVSPRVLSVKFRRNPTELSDPCIFFFLLAEGSHTYTLTHWHTQGSLSHWPFPLLQWEARFRRISPHASTTIPSAPNQAWTSTAAPSSAHLQPHAQAMTQPQDNGRISKCVGVSKKAPSIVCQLRPQGEQRMLEGLRVRWLPFLIHCLPSEFHWFPPLEVFLFCSGANLELKWIWLSWMLHEQFPGSYSCKRFTAKHIHV